MLKWSDTCCMWSTEHTLLTATTAVMLIKQISGDSDKKYITMIWRWNRFLFCIFLCCTDILRQPLNVLHCILNTYEVCSDANTPGCQWKSFFVNIKVINATLFGVRGWFGLCALCFNQSWRIEKKCWRGLLIQLCAARATEWKALQRLAGPRDTSLCDFMGLWSGVPAPQEEFQGRHWLRITTTVALKYKLPLQRSASCTIVCLTC